MAFKLKPLHDQVMVITGASSGIGRATAKAAAARGAAVVLAARNEAALASAVAEIRAAGGRATSVVTDVTDFEQVRQLANTTVREYGGFDTWVNNAGLGVYGRIMDVPIADEQRLFAVNYWGVVYGCRVAVPHLRQRAHHGYGGAIINLGSVVSDIAVPLLASYVASKHAIKAFTDTLRLELEAERAPISVTLIKPAGIDTPFFDHARNYLSAAPQPVPPVYAPAVVADAILTSAERPVRDVFAGGTAKLFSVLNTVAPRLLDMWMERTGFRQQQRFDRPAERADTLYQQHHDSGTERGTYAGPVRRRSTYTTATLTPGVSTLVAASLGLALVAGMRARRDHNGTPAWRRLPEWLQGRK